MTDNQKLEQLLNEQQFMVLAVTLEDGTPWVTPVRIQKSNSNEFEWDSVVTAEHSKALTTNPKMAITIFQKKEDSQIGLYAKGTGELVEELKPGFGRYRFTAKQCWINDETFVKREVILPSN